VSTQSEVVTDPYRRHWTILVALAVLLASSAGYWISRNVEAAAIGRPDPDFLNVFYYLFGAHEQPFFLIAGLGSIVSLMLLRLTPASEVQSEIAAFPVSLTLLACVVLVTAWAGSHIVLHNFPLSMDEYNAVFQAEIFAAGNIAAVVPPPWSEIVNAIKPEYVSYKPEQGIWFSSYLPVYAALRAPFTRLGVDGIVNPLLAAGSIVCLAMIGRRIWPDQLARSQIAVLLLLSSSQFLLTSMSWYAMPAHLALNLVWLLFYLRGGWGDHLILMIVGFLALGLHNPFPHALFVAPFILRLLRSKRYWRFASLAVTYTLSAIVWAAWLKYSLSVEQSGEVSAVFGFPTPHDILTQAMSLSLIVSWQAPIFAIGLLLGIVRLRSQSSIERDLAAGFLLTCLFFVFFKASQGHGWGYRYIYGVIGNAAILATVGICSLARDLKPPITRAFIVGSIAIAVLVQLPMRALQAHHFVRPWANASSYLSGLPTEAVAIPAKTIWYGYDLSRARPFLGESGNVVLRTDSRAVLNELETEGIDVVIVPCADLVEFGLHGKCEAITGEKR
jgi:hypothetical protein